MIFHQSIFWVQLNHPRLGGLSVLMVVLFPYIFSSTNSIGQRWFLWMSKGTPTGILQFQSSASSARNNPIGSMYGIYANIGGILMVNVTIYSIHGSYGNGSSQSSHLWSLGHRRPIPYVSSHGQNGRAKTVTMRRLNFFDRHVVKQDMWWRRWHLWLEHRENHGKMVIYMENHHFLMGI